MRINYFSYRSSSKLPYCSWSLYLYYNYPLFFHIFFHIFFQFVSSLFFFFLTSFFLCYFTTSTVYADVPSSQVPFNSFTSANRDFDSHADAAFYYAFSGHHFLLPFAESATARVDLPCQILDFGFEKVPVYCTNSPGLVFLGLELNFSFARPVAVGIDFFDYVLGRPRSVKTVLELIGFALSAFCGGKALEAYYLQHHR